MIGMGETSRVLAILDRTGGVGGLRRDGCRLWSCRHQFLLRQWQCVKKGLHGGLAKAPVALMGSPLVVVDQPGIEIGLQWVGLTRSTHDRRPAGFGASFPFPLAPVGVG
jgi:hypothetical protein